MQGTLTLTDTILLSISPLRLQNHLGLVVDEGKRYGLELNWEKTMVLRIQCDANLFGPDGVARKVVPHMVYLGGLITDDVSARPKLARRLGETNRAFEALVVCGSHAHISRVRKIEI